MHNSDRLNKVYKDCLYKWCHHGFFFPPKQKMRLSALIKESREISSSFHHVRTQREGVSYGEEDPQQRTWLCWCLDLGRPVSRTENYISDVFKLPSLWQFFIAAQTDWQGICEKLELLIQSSHHTISQSCFENHTYQ